MTILNQLLPAPVNGGYREDDHWIWCGSAIRDRDGLFHMFASRWSKRVPFNPNWTTNSQIVRATSKIADGPYTFAEVVFGEHDQSRWDGGMTHNPTIHFCPSTNRYLLFYTGSTYTDPQPTDCAASESQRLESRQNQRIGLAVAQSPAGPWQKLDAPILIPRGGKWDALMTTNPAPYVLPDGSILLAYKSIATHATKQLQYGIARADSWDKPFTRLSDGPIFQFDDPKIDIEDAYLWHDGTRFQMLLKDMGDKLTGEFHAGVQAWSDDAIHWAMHAPAKAYSRSVLFDDGVVRQMGSLERPQLLIQDGRPTHLFAATGDGPGGFWRANHTWNLCIPLSPPPVA